MLRFALVASMAAAAAAAPCSPDTDLFTHKVTIEHSTLASISYHGYYKKVDVETPSGKYTALLVQEGCDAPETLPAGVDFVNATITIPVTAVGVTDTSTLPFVEQLGERPSIKAVGTSAAYITSNCIHHQIDTEKTIVAMDENWSYDTAAAKAAGVDGASAVTLAGQYSAAAVVAAEMNMIPMQEPYEPTSLGSAEWMKIVSALFNKEEAATKTFAGTVNRLECAETKGIDKAKTAKSRILWMSSYSDWQTGGEIINVGKCATNVSPYYCEYAEMTGATIVNYTALNILPDATGSHTAEQINELCKSADYLFYQSDFDTMWTGRGLNASAMKDCALIADGKVYDMQAADVGGNAVFERKLSEPDLMVGDFANIVESAMHPHVAKIPNAFLRNVMTEAVAHNADKINPACTTDAEAAAALPPINRECLLSYFVAAGEAGEGGEGGDGSGGMMPTASAAVAAVLAFAVAAAL